MLFTSIEFLFLFLPVALLVYYLTRRWISHQAALVSLTLASFVFYSWWDIRFLPIMLVSIVLNHLIGVIIQKRETQPWLAAGIVANLGLLGVFKYTDFIIANVNAALGSDIPLTGVPLPLAISFFTFQQISFLVDVARRKTQPGTVSEHALFVAFFPQLIAGPIVHHNRIAGQYADAGRRDDLADNFAVGTSIFAIGLAKKVLLADNLAPYASSAFDSAARGDEVGLLLAWTGALAYSFQIFFDFSGYSDMALGLGRMFGYHLPINFNAPYRARSVAEFWRRWHITLSNFLRDYLYIPLGGNRAGFARTIVNLFIVMLLGGLWHGAAWTFVVWGGLHGAALAWNHWFKQVRPQGIAPSAPVISIVLTFLFVTLTWVFFRAESFDAAYIMLSGMSGLNGLGASVGDEPFIAIAIGFLVVYGLPDTPSIFYRQLDARA